jgi:NAD-dependent dihydropyrimidine dehydrogenase PreA subunit
MFLIEVDVETCTGCGACVVMCPANVFRVDPEEKADPFQLGRCVGCMACIESCPVKCIRIREI